ncbi:hypothetical protein SEA_FORZA_81 [Gordonia phage Forza]|uniref:Uncharacterized protein n=1 Tax=Gordonia phage Forza TaxID=2571247 RepID=A0A650EYE3_9CAUD|nr:hypothetical protein PP303_gp081 [Gordonia phage Forza]QEM41550.1 hypothetical protein SEA_BOOPY_81 [Gordonia phage Boopy]QGT55074.1 hypothetical protein SEA_FORZA_81 [Gordonia phage Forza]UXE04224.1 hypothetical protein SEA_BLUENGOLD_80 [Gordonia phage BlueNGold]WBF03863.1 hypothetical protein SEA_MAREELIH_80 [Gordonia phage Mareelih]
MTNEINPDKFTYKEGDLKLISLPDDVEEQNIEFKDDAMPPTPQKPKLAKSKLPKR